MNAIVSEQPDVAAALAGIRRVRPLVHCITNDVVMNPTANALLALGASPVMAHAPEESAEITARAAALVVNLGTPTKARAEAMRLSTASAHRAGIPWILDPVGVGASEFRHELARGLVDSKPAVIRGNAGEILSLAWGEVAAGGVDSAAGVSDEVRDAARALAQEQGCVVAVTGFVDFVTDGDRELRVHNGHPLMARVTGTGCMLGAVLGACLAVRVPPFEAAVSALVLFGVAGERAGAGDVGPGTFQVRLFDALAALGPADIARDARISP